MGIMERVGTVAPRQGLLHRTMLGDLAVGVDETRGYMALFTHTVN